MRVSAIMGARTKLHTDKFNGPYKSYVIFHTNDTNPCYLKYFLFPKFRTSLKGRHFIPVGYSERKLIILIGLKNDSIDAQKYEVPVEAIDLIEPFGNLPYAVIGIKGGVLQVCPTDSYQVISKPLCFPTKSFQEALHDASKNPVTKKPRRSYYSQSPK
jgi:hypothetical protein